MCAHIPPTQAMTAWADYNYRINITESYLYPQKHYVPKNNTQTFFHLIPVSAAD